MKCITFHYVKCNVNVNSHYIYVNYDELCECDATFQIRKIL